MNPNKTFNNPDLKINYYPVNSRCTFFIYNSSSIDRKQVLLYIY